MTPLYALVLGIVQGLTEFLPISSSGHLLIVPRLFGWEEQPLAFDVALHIGTLTAVLVYFFRDWVALARSGLADLRAHGLRLTAWSAHGRLLLLIALGTVPAVVVGLLLSDAEDRLRTPAVVGAMLILVGSIMAAAERFANRPRQGAITTSAQGSELEKRLSPVRALVIGVAQAFALVPGVSRSGATISAGMFSGLSRATAARFSFLIATPITLAAAAKELPQLRTAAEQGVSRGEIGLGVAASALVGLLAISALLRFLATRPLYPFSIYRVIVGVLVLLFLAR